MLLYTKIDRFGPLYLTKYKTNLYFQEVTIVNIEVWSQLEHSKVTFKFAMYPAILKCGEICHYELG